MKSQSSFVKIVFAICFLVAVAGCNNDTKSGVSGKAGHGHSHD
jgi:hypothetical protein